MKYVMFGHAGSGNHGCEAIVRSTEKILEGGKYYLETPNLAEDEEFKLTDICKPIVKNDQKINQRSVIGLYLKAKAKLDKNYDFDDYVNIYKNRDLYIKNSVALSVGGDNYCYISIIHDLRAKLKGFKKHNIPTILWGCSVGTEYLNKQTCEDLKSYDLITARESQTIENLYNKGIKDNVISCSDPAFLLDAEKTDYLSDFFAEAEVIGLNVSDFMKFYNSYNNATFNNFRKLVEYILKNTDYKILLIPHVTQYGNDDLVPINALKKEFSSNRVAVAEKRLNCMQLKYLISKCKMFVGCRTHSTIAAYSTTVPTLVVGYSVKAQGIAKDIFGDTKDLIVDVNGFNSDDDLTRTFINFSEKKDYLKDHLSKVMPDYIARAYNAKDALINRVIEK